MTPTVIPPTLSASSLQDYVDCARRYQLRYVEALQWPAAIAEPLREFERHTQRGADFHHVIHQHHLGLPAEAVGRHIQDADLRRWWDAYLASDYAYGGSVAGDRYAEISFAAQVGGGRLIAKLDLLIVRPDALTIVDWKTSARKPRRDKLASRLQSRVYPFVMAATEVFERVYPPDAITMVYWYANAPESPEIFAYSAEQFAADQQYLDDLIREMAGQSIFPLTDDKRRCEFCAYRSLCDRGIRAGDMDDLGEADSAEVDALALSDFDIDLDNIAEVEF